MKHLNYSFDKKIPRMKEFERSIDCDAISEFWGFFLSNNPFGFSCYIKICFLRISKMPILLVKFIRHPVGESFLNLFSIFLGDVMNFQAQILQSHHFNDMRHFFSFLLFLSHSVETSQFFCHSDFT